MIVPRRTTRPGFVRGAVSKQTLTSVPTLVRALALALALASASVLAACGAGTAHTGGDAAAAADGALGDGATSDAVADVDGGGDAGASEDADVAACGNGTVEPPEVCDDGNLVDGDGCSADCSESVVTVSLGIDSPAYDIARDSADRVHLIRRVGSGPGTTLRYGLITDCVLTGDVEAASAGGLWTRGFRPRLAVKPDGTVLHTSWGDGALSEIHHAWNDGSGWQQALLFTQPGGMFVAQPVSGVDQAGTVHIIALYQEDAAPFSGRIAYWRIDAGGTALESAAIIDGPDSGTDWRSTALFTTLSGDVHAVWKAPNHWGKHTFAPSGTSLVGQPHTDIPPAPASAHTGMGDLFVTEAGDVHAACTDFVGTDAGIWHALLPAGAAAFDEPTTQAGPFTDNGGTLNFDPWAAVAVEPVGGRVLVAWGENPTGTGVVSNVYLSTLTAGAWTQTVLDSDADIHQFSKVAMAVTSDTTYVVWRSATPTGSELLCSRLRYGN